ncbi:MAG: hypothetical protein KF778_17120 [Rhodocyclaceae bacterium]|nr:hypothetical protein [Rhodocyclaceae bacterium]
MVTNNWIVKRIELLFYNACENRWEMFQESGEIRRERYDPLADAFSRRQIQGLLETVRSIFSKIHKIDGSRIWCKGDAINQREGEIRFLLSLDGDTGFGKDFLAYCEKALEGEGVDDVTLLKELRSSGTVVSVPFPSALNLVSVLPVAFDWDVFGALGAKSTGARSKTVDEYLDDAGIHNDYLYRFFVYCVQHKRNGDGSFDASVQLAAAGEGGSARSGNKVPYADFVQIRCREMSGDEKNLYHYYSRIIDEFQASTKAGDDPRSSLTYYAVYPIIACGYKHYLQLEVEPCGESGVPHGVEDSGGMVLDCYEAFNAWFTAHRADYLIFKESLRELLVQIRLSAFNHRVTNWIIDNRERILRSKDPRRESVECFSMFAPQINEMMAIEAERRFWGHVPSRERDDHSCPVRRVLRPWREFEFEIAPAGGGAETSDFGQSQAWTDVLKKEICIHGDPPVSVLVASISSHRINICICPTQSNEVLNECFTGTNLRRLEEQFFAVQNRILKLWHGARP